MIRLAWLILLSFAALAAPGQAREPTSNPDSETIAAAERFVEATDMESSFTAMTSELIDGLSAGMAENIAEQTGEEFPPALLVELRTVLTGQMLKIYRANAVALKRGMALVHARHFTKSELDRLTELMSDPVMRKYMQSMERLMPEMGSVWATVIGTRYDEETEDLIKRTITEYLQKTGELPNPVS